MGTESPPPRRLRVCSGLGRDGPSPCPFLRGTRPLRPAATPVHRCPASSPHSEPGRGQVCAGPAGSLSFHGPTYSLPPWHERGGRGNYRRLPLTLRSRGAPARRVPGQAAARPPVVPRSVGWRAAPRLPPLPLSLLRTDHKQQESSTAPTSPPPPRVPSPRRGSPLRDPNREQGRQPWLR
jgi:hypothetical protein